jgi:hypothetical protein
MKTLAIVIGNDAYHESAKLDYPVKDAQAIADVFSRLGYDVIHKSNCNSPEIPVLLEEIESKIGDYDATIFFFAGHGFQYEGENYLTSVECQIPPANKWACNSNSIALSNLLGIFKKHPDKINIVIIDACRKSFDRGTSTTFAPVLAPKGTLIAFSTSPEEGAKDGGFAGHSVYAGALLEYIGRERLSVEELFKKVRKTVYNLTDGKQTPWEHTSLIGDFYFNTGQLVHSVDIPYHEDVVKDVNYKSNGDQFSNLIIEVRSNNWDRQNPAIERLLQIRPASLDKNQQFILGRNLLQAGDYANSATAFFSDPAVNIGRYTHGGENHLLNGILFEIYFNKHGEFRTEHFKAQCFDKVMSLRKITGLASSFSFIGQLLLPYLDIRPFWIPVATDDKMDVDVLAAIQNQKDWMGNDEQYDVISAIKVLSTDITDQIRSYDITGQNALGLKSAISKYLTAPLDLIHVNNNIPIQRIGFPPRPVDESQTGW